MQAMTRLYDSTFVSMHPGNFSKLCWLSLSDCFHALTLLSLQYCNQCFLQLFRQRMLDPWLVKSNFTNYLIDQFNDIQANCSTTLPYTTSSSTLYVGTV